MSKSKELSPLSYGDLVRKTGAIPDNALPVVFVDGQHQYRSPGMFAQNPPASVQDYSDHIRAMSEYIEQNETLTYGYNDVAVCMTRVLRRCDTGITRSKKMGPFTLPEEMVVETGFNRDGVMQHETIPGDWMTIPGFDGQCKARCNNDGTGSVMFQFKRHDQGAINGLFAFIREELEQRSIYRGQVITTDYKFINVTGFDRAQVVFNRDLAAAVNVACISSIIDLDANIAAGENPKRSVLLSGPPGTGKTLLGKTSQSILYEMGYTAVLCPPGCSAKEMAKGLAIARNYMTGDSIVGLFIEDVEKMAQHDRSLALDNLDGAISKSDRILIIMTTNFPDNVDPAFLRPGRVDDYIEVGLPDQDAFMRLIQQRLKGRLGENIDWNAAFAAYHDYTPAWIVGGMSKVIRSVIARTHSADDITVTTEDLITGATLLRRQWELQNESANRPPEIPTLDQAFRQAAEQWMENISVPEIDYGNIGETVDNVVENRINGAAVELETETGKPVTGNITTC
jgi:DNA polymerase III delta prime subunit